MTMPNDSSTPRTKAPLLAWILLISVILNLFLVGVLAGSGPGGRHKFFKPMALSSNHGEYMVEWITRSLEPQDATVFHNVVQLQSSALKQSHEQVHKAIQDVAITFEQDPPDPLALKTAVNHLNQVKGQVDEVVGQIIQDAYPQLSADGRHRLAELTR